MRPTKFPPGPKGLAVFGYLQGGGRQRLAAWQRLAGEYGDVVYARILGKDYYLLNHPDLVHEALVERADGVTALKLGERARTPKPEKVADERAYHRRMRKLIQPAFTPRRLAPYADVMVAYTQAFTDAWQAGEVRDIGADMNALTLRIVGRTLFDADVSSTTDVVGDAVTRVSEYLAHGAPVFLPTPRNLRLLRAWLRFDKVIADIITARKTAAHPPADVLSTILDAVDETDNFRLTDQQAKGLVISLFVAGHETTAVALTWTWYLLGRHPHVAAKLVEEVDRVLGGRAPTADDVEHLTYTDWVFREAMRLYTPVWVLSRQVVTGAEIGGYTAPGGSFLLISPYVIQRDARFYADPDTFQPERWSNADDVPRYAYLPFGGGPHVCIGQFFAWMEAVLIIASVAQRWRLIPADDTVIDIEPLVTIRPASPIRMRVERRQVD